MAGHYTLPIQLPAPGPSTDISQCPGSPRCGSQGSHEPHKPGPADAKTYKYLKIGKNTITITQLLPQPYSRSYKLYFGGKQTVIINRLVQKSAPRMGYNN